MRKKTLAVLFLSLFAVSLLLPIFNPSSKVHATSKAFSSDSLCVPNYRPSNPKSNTVWDTGAFTFQFIDRAHVKVVYNETGTCHSPPGLSSKYIHPSGLEFAGLANQTLSYWDDGLGWFAQPSNHNYSKTNESNISGANEGFFTTSDHQSVDWSFYQNHVSTTIDKIFSNAQYKFSTEETNLNSAGVNCGNENQGMQLANDSDGVAWYCRDSTLNGTGSHVNGHLDSNTKLNYNIVFVASSDGKTLTNIFSSIDGSPSHNFQWCQNSKYNNGQGVFQNALDKQTCAGDSVIPNLTPDNLVKLAQGTQLVTIQQDSKDLGQQTIQVFIAGSANSAAAQIGSTAPANGGVNFDCDVKFWNPLTWIVCPMVELFQGIINFLDQEINHFLNVPVDFFTETCTKGQLINNSSEKCTGSGADFYKAWASMRTIALVLLILIGLVMVIAQAISIGPLDAYTVRKIMPRLALAVIGISLSWPIMRGLVILSNDLGNATRGIIQAPFIGLPLPSLSVQSQSILTGSFGAGLFALGPLGMLSFVATAAMAVIIAFAVLLIRQIVIALLAILAPLAIILFILPNTQKAWNLWWDSFIKALLMFPIIAAFIAAGRVFARVSVATDIANGKTGAEGTFRLAGGALGTIGGFVNDRGRGAFDRLKKFRQERGAQRRERLGRRILGTRADWQKRLQDAGSNTKFGAVRRLAARQASRVVGGYNVQGADALRRAAVGKELNDQIATGRDDEIRGLSVDKKTAAQRINNDGIKQFQTLGGAWVSEAAVDAGHRRWGNDTYAQQASLSYEMRKANTEEQLQGLAQNYHNVAKAWNLTDNQAAGAWIGAAFENQNQHLEYKYTDWKTGGMSADKAAEFATEVYEKKGSYPLAQMSSNTIDSLGIAYDQAVSSGDFDTQKQIQGIADTFMYRGGAGGIGAVGEDERPIALGGGGRVDQANTPGAAHVAEQVRKLAVHVGVYQPPDPTTNTQSSGPPPQIDRQN
ncbi:hypothetical protein HY218_02360 [Candidatus Saccharibacteria bacterium]|nr:hypothetical protein [Candidatus Saccharibacteria bacterium]